MTKKTIAFVFGLMGACFGTMQNAGAVGEHITINRVTCANELSSFVAGLLAGKKGNGEAVHKNCITAGLAKATAEQNNAIKGSLDAYAHHYTPLLKEIVINYAHHLLGEPLVPYTDVDEATQEFFKNPGAMRNAILMYVQPDLKPGAELWNLQLGCISKSHETAPAPTNKKGKTVKFIPGDVKERFERVTDRAIVELERGEEYLENDAKRVVRKVETALTRT